jgi:hypothetical protein
VSPCTGIAFEARCEPAILSVCDFFPFPQAKENARHNDESASWFKWNLTEHKEKAKQAAS